MRLLLIDRSPVFLRSASRLCQDLPGCHVLGFTRPGDALEAAGMIAPQVVMLDLHMGLADKGELIRCLRALCPSAVIVALMLDAQEPGRHASLALGANASLPKGSLTVPVLGQLAARLNQRTEEMLESI